VDLLPCRSSERLENPLAIEPIKYSRGKQGKENSPQFILRYKKRWSGSSMHVTYYFASIFAFYIILLVDHLLRSLQ